MPNSRDRIDVTCPCGASLTVEASAQTCVDRLNDWSKDHKNHRATAPVVIRDRWYPGSVYPTPYAPTWTSTSLASGGHVSTTNKAITDTRPECHIVNSAGTLTLAAN